jgi:plastocyanin
MRPVYTTLLVFVMPAALTAPLQVSFVGVDGKAIGGTVVMLRSTDQSRPVAKSVPSVLDQVDRQFVPNVLVVPVGSPVVFPNSDTVSHQVYSFSPAKKFQLPLYRGKPYPPVIFDRPGVATLGCNIHDQMRAYVYVVEAQYYGRMDARGLWSAADVVPGEYRIEIWHPLSRVQRPVFEQVVNVPANGSHLTLRAALPLKLRAENQQPSNWDVY